MAEDRNPPLLNPVLSLQTKPTPTPGRGGGKSRKDIATGRLEQQRQRLALSARALFDTRTKRPSYAGKVHLVAQMYSDSLAARHVPNNLFSLATRCALVAPYPSGYLLEATQDSLLSLARAIEAASSVGRLVDISRVKSLSWFDGTALLRGRPAEAVWEDASEDDGGRLFVVWLAPFRDQNARQAVLEQVEAFTREEVLLPSLSRVRLLPGPMSVATPPTSIMPQGSGVARAISSYRNTGVGHAVVRIRDKDKFARLMASGISVRIDPVKSLGVASPGEGREPGDPPAPNGHPIVAVIDGGLHAPSYASVEAWRMEPPLIQRRDADRLHGNAVSSLVVQAHAWNNNRDIPTLYCRIGSVQAIPHEASAKCVYPEDIVDYLTLVGRTHPDASIWNISANQKEPEEASGEVSYLGHQITNLARHFNVLPVISVGNVSAKNGTRLCPPADCEAAIVVGGRTADLHGHPAGPCPVCLPGPGPDGMLKPDLSWFSELRTLGGGTVRGSSYATPLVSRVAAHTFSRLKMPSPDLVKALLINAAEGNEHDPRLGWGTPYHGTLPWTCSEGSVTLAWTAHLRPGFNYYWRNIPIPPELTSDGKLFGGASLTAILNPLTSPTAGTNYFASRLQTALQYPMGGRRWGNLLGTMKESTLAELDARRELKKWQPVRRHCRDFSRRNGVSYSGKSFKLLARVYARDLYQFGIRHHSELEPQETAFVLTFWAGSGERTIYDSTVRLLGNEVQSAVLDQQIELRNS